jgi:transposase
LRARAFKAATSRRSLANSKHDPTFGVPSENELAGARFQGHHVAQITRPLSNDLRERVVAAIVGGESCRSVASRFGVAVSSVVKWSQRYRATGSVAPGKVGGHRKRVLEPHRAFVLERIGQTPHLTLHGLKEELAARGVNVSHNAVWLFLRREGLRFKKNAVRP